MPRFRLLALLAILATAPLLAATAAAPSQPASPLAPGSKAPPLAATKWLTPLPTTIMERGKVYVLLFWNISDPGAGRQLAHLADLARTHESLECIALHDVAPPLTLAEVERWTDARRAWLHLSIGADELHSSWNAWMTLSGADAAPTAFIINRDGRIAFSGPPEWIDSPLAEVLTGDWEFSKADGLADTLEKRRTAMLALADTDPAAFLAEWDFFHSNYPLAVADRPELRIAALRKLGRDDEARRWTDTLISDLMMRRDAAAMLGIAQAHVRAAAAPESKPTPADLTVARHTASLADQLAEGRSPAAKAALAEAWFLAEGYPHAITEITSAIELEQDPDARARYQSLRRKYEAAEGHRSRPRRR